MKKFFKGDKGTIRPLKELPPEHRSYKLQKLSQATLGAGNMKENVRLPKGENVNDWLASHVVDFYDTLVSLYSLIKDECTEKSCPEMKAGPGFTYAWQDNDKYKKSTIVPAPQYIEFVFDWVAGQVDNEAIFPSNPDVPFPSDFKAIVSKIFQRYFRIYAHIFHHHRHHMTVVGGEPHLNTTFKHFMYFTHEFDLIPEAQLVPLKDIIPVFD